MPEIVGTLRLDQPWGAVQLSAAAHQVDASLLGAPALTTPPTTYAFPALTSNSYGFAVQGGLILNTDFISPGDKFWLQATYEKGAYGYIAGDNLGFNYGAVNQFLRRRLNHIGFERREAVEPNRGIGRRIGAGSFD